MARKRDYKAEYRRRIERGLARGLSRSQSRGHPKPGEAAIQSKSKAPQPDERLEAAVKLIRDGKSQRAAAQAAGVSADRLRRFTHHYGIAKYRNGKWEMTDERWRIFPTITKRQVRTVTAPGYEEARIAGVYWHAKSQFLESNDEQYLLPFIGQGITDVKGRFHPFETEPNELYRLAAMELPEFHEIYRIISPD